LTPCTVAYVLHWVFSEARDSARTNLDQALKSGAAFTGSDEAKKTLVELKR
jgi:hypothetical protein